MREKIGNFRLLERLGEGGMGVVYAAHDDRLGRRVAIKMIRGEADPSARSRFWREARAAARINHPNVCQLHDVGEDGGDLYIAMELLEGESLVTRLERGPLELGEAGTVALGVLAALEELHGHQIIHRDLKPSNTFLTPHGVKLLDFGLARLVEMSPEGGAEAALTQTGVVFGTPRYMAPEQWRGEQVDSRADLFALGTLLFEMLTGNPAFPGRSPAEVRHAALFDQPPALSGPAAVAAVDEVIRRALAKRPEERYPSAAVMADALRDALGQAAGAEVRHVRAVTRIIVLPFRMLRPDPEIDFLSFSLPDAIASSLSGFESLVVRSTLAAPTEAASPDFDRLAREAQVDLVVAGTLLRAGDQLRVSAQLVEAPAGTVIWSQSTQTALRDIFELQDEVARRIVESLSIPLSGKERRSLQADVPANAKAYEFFLRANQLGLDVSTWELARDLYVQCLDADPGYAPAWAQLGRIYRLLAKYKAQGVEENMLRAAEAFRRALELNPDLSVAHHLRANLEVEMGRSIDAMIHLLDRAQSHRTDPAIYVGLVHACRYCGLNRASLAADGLARRIDPTVRTSVGWTLWMMGEFDRAIEMTDVMNFLHPYALAASGRTEEAIRFYAEIEKSQSLDVARALFVSQRAALQGRRDESLAAIRLTVASGFRDPEGIYFLARTAAFLGEAAEALAMLDRVVYAGYLCDQILARDPWLDSVRSKPEFGPITARAREGRLRAAAAYLEHKGDRVLGVQPES